MKSRHNLDSTQIFIWLCFKMPDPTREAPFYRAFYPTLLITLPGGKKTGILYTHAQMTLKGCFLIRERCLQHQENRERLKQWREPWLCTEAKEHSSFLVRIPLCKPGLTKETTNLASQQNLIKKKRIRLGDSPANQGPAWKVWSPENTSPALRKHT